VAAASAPELSEDRRRTPGRWAARATGECVQVFADAAGESE